MNRFMDETQIPAANPDVVLERMDGELLLYHASATRSLFLNESAGLIWSCCDGRRTVGQIVELLRDHYPDAAATIGRDVEETLQRFVELDVLSMQRS